jgi:CRP-like cAMP-binding protein
MTQPLNQLGEGPPRENIVALLRGGCWAALPIATIESLIAGGTLTPFSAGHTVYAEAEAERLAVIVLGLLRVYMHAGDGRQVTVRYVRPGELLGVPALVGGPAPVFVQAITAGAAFFFDVARVKRAACRRVDRMGLCGGIGASVVRRPRRTRG